MGFGGTDENMGAIGRPAARRANNAYADSEMCRAGAKSSNDLTPSQGAVQERTKRFVSWKSLKKARFAGNLFNLFSRDSQAWRFVIH